MAAPEGSEARRKARAMLLRSIDLSLGDGMSAAEWRLMVSAFMGRAVDDAGPDDIDTIVRLGLNGSRRR